MANNMREARKSFRTKAERLAAEFSLDEAPGYLLRRLDAAAADMYEQSTGQNDLTPRQFGVLVRLYQLGPMKQSELGTRLNIDRSTLGEMVSRMVDRGLLNRGEAGSRRSAELSLTRVGEKTLLVMIEPVIASQRKLLELLPEEYRALFVKCLKVLADNVAPPQNA